MNMKKTIAAVAACAVATSAMATTVFADDSVTLHYNLTHNYYSVSAGTATFSSQIEYLNDTGTEDGGFVQIQFKSLAGNLNAKIAKWTVTGNTIEGGVRDKTFNFNNFSDYAIDYAGTRSSWVKGTWGGVSVMTIPVGDKGINASTDGGFTANVSVTVGHEDTSWNGAGLAAELSYVVGEDLGALNVIDTDVLDKNDDIVKYVNSYNTDDVSDPVKLAAVVKEEDIVDGTVINYKDVKNATEIYAAPNVIAEIEAGTLARVCDEDLVKNTLYTVMDGYTAATEKIVKFPMMTSANTTSNLGTDGITNLEGDINVVYRSDVKTGIYGWVQKDVMTTVDGSVSNILDYLSDDDFNLSAKGKSYINVVPVINDVIANYDDVTFTFNTAADGVELSAQGDKNNSGFILDYSGDGEKKFTKFAQHLYNLYGDENTEYVYAPTTYDWTGYNLWAGALVVNGNLTMSLQDTNVFDYGATTLSFNWNDAVDGAVVNTYATYLTKMQLATSCTWFWDSLDITAANTEAEEVKSEAGVEAEEDVIEEDVEEDVVEEDIEEDVVEEDVEEDVVEDVVVDEPVVEDVPVVENPGTGNAPIALAVIPVALAAAAVVAKKRG